MQTHIIENGVVVNTIVATIQEAESVFPDAICIDGTKGGIGWLWDGVNLTPPPVPSKTPEQIQSEIIEATQFRLDSFAQTRGYDSILSACTYATSPTAKFSQEGQYCVAQRDATWAKLYEMLAEVQAGTRPLPTGFADIEPELPTLAWPN